MYVLLSSDAKLSEKDVSINLHLNYDQWMESSAVFVHIYNFNKHDLVLWPVLLDIHHANTVRFLYFWSYLMRTKSISWPGLFKIVSWKVQCKVLGQGHNYLLLLATWYTVNPVKKLGYHKLTCITTMAIFDTLNTLTFGCKCHQSNCICGQGVCHFWAMRQYFKLQ